MAAIKITEGAWKTNKVGWLTLESGEYEAKMLRFEHGSQYGIDGGCISKLEIRKKGYYEFLANYDRGWDIKPKEEVRDFYNAILERFN